MTQYDGHGLTTSLEKQSYSVLVIRCIVKTIIAVVVVIQRLMKCMFCFSGGNGMHIHVIEENVIYFLCRYNNQQPSAWPAHT